MSQLRQRFRCSWDDGPLVEGRTNALDASAAADYQHNPVLASMAAIHHALDRLGHQVGSFEEWVEVLDTFHLLTASGAVATEVTELGEPVEPDPTGAAPPPGTPSPSPSSPAPTGGPGPKMNGRSRPVSRSSQRSNAPDAGAADRRTTKRTTAKKTAS